jgi:dethiobiotin synthetase
LLVTGTDTGVGKTVVAAALVFALRARGVRAVGFKPAETGIDLGGPTDSELLERASAGPEPLAAPLLRLAEPLAPAVAAERAGHSLEPGAVEQRLQQLRSAGYTVVVEGAGGLLVPLAWGFDVADLAARHELAAIVVARAGLGTLNHVLLTAEALRSRGVALRGVVLNGRGEPPDLAEQTNPSLLARLLTGVPVVVLPRREGGEALGLAADFASMLDPLLSEPPLGG